MTRSPSGQAAPTGAGVVGELHPACSRARGACSSSTSSELSRRERRGALRGRDHVPRRSPGPRVLRARGRGRRRSRRAAHEAAGPELREMRAFDVYRGGQVGEGRKSIAFSVSFPVERAHALRRGCGGASREDRRRAGRALRRRAPSLSRRQAGARRARARITLRWILAGLRRARSR